MATTPSAFNTMLDALGATASHVSLHTADPTTTGASEVTGGSYARQAVTWNAAAAANLDSSNQPAFSVPSGTTVTHFGVWTASTGGTFLFGGALAASETFGGDGTYTLSDLDYNLADA